MKTVKMVPISEYVSLKMEVDRLTAMISDLTDQLRDAQQHSNTGMEKGIFVWKDGVSTFIRIRDILMMKADSNYSVIHLKNGQCIFTSHTLKYWAEKCNSPLLIRVHKSYIINSKCILAVEQKAKKIILEGDRSVPFSKTFKSLFTA